MSMRTEDRPRRNGATAEISLKSASFGDFTFNLMSCELRRGGRVVHLRPRAARALGLLIENAGQVVHHEQLKSAIWGNAVVEWRTGLHQIVRDLRKALNDGKVEHVVIESVSRRGYRFRAAVRPVRMRQSFLPVNHRDFAYLLAGASLVPALVIIACVLLGAS